MIFCNKIVMGQRVVRSSQSVLRFNELSMVCHIYLAKIYFKPSYTFFTCEGPCTREQKWQIVELAIQLN